MRTARGDIRGTLAYHNLMEPEVELPDGRGDFAIDGWVELAIGWTSPNKGVRLHWEQFLREKRDPSEGPDEEEPLFGINGWEIELRPHPFAGLKLEKTRQGGLSCLGLVVNPVFGKEGTVDFLLEANISHDKVGLPKFLVGDWSDEGRGMIYTLSLGIGI